MGFLNFSKYNSEEKELLDIYSQMFVIQGMSSEEARKSAEEMLDRAIEKSKISGVYGNLPQKLGDIILGDTETDDDKVKNYVEGIRQEIPAKIREGVQDEDIRLWWNLCDIERWMVLEEDESARLLCFVNSMEKGLSSEEAVARMRKIHPIYGDPEDTTNTKGENRPLPYELKNRINTYIGKRISTDPDKYKEEMEQSSSFNALVRKEIKVGNL